MFLKRRSYGMPAMITLARQKRFDELNHILAESPINEIVGWMQNCSQIFNTKMLGTSSTPLHIILKFNPPAVTVKLLIERLREINPDAVHEEAIDHRGRTPLHVACAYKVDVSVIFRLITGMTLAMPAFRKDDDDRLPIHVLCSGPLGPVKTLRFRFLSGETVRNLNKVILLLLKVYPESILVRDKDGYLPVELAMRNHMPDSVIMHLVQKATAFNQITKAVKLDLKRETSNEEVYISCNMTHQKPMSELDHEEVFSLDSTADSTAEDVFEDSAVVESSTPEVAPSGLVVDVRESSIIDLDRREKRVVEEVEIFLVPHVDAPGGEGGIWESPFTMLDAISNVETTDSMNVNITELNDDKYDVVTSNDIRKSPLTPFDECDEEEIVFYCSGQ